MEAAMQRVAPLLMLALFSEVVWAQSVPAQPEWGPDARLTFDAGPSSLSYNFARTVAADDSGTVHVVWFEERSGVSHVFYKRSANGGAGWTPDIRLSDGPIGSQHPSVAVSGPHVYVVWHDFRHRRPDVYFRQSNDRGVTWLSEQRLTPDDVDGAHQAIAASAGRVHVVWGSRRDGQAEVYTRASTDSGTTWASALRVSDLPYESWVSTVAVAGERVYVAWVDYGDANEEEYLRRSSDGGVTWEPPFRLTEDAADSWAGSIAVSGSTVHYTWFDRRDAGVTDSEVEHALNRALALVGVPASAPPPRDPAVYYLNPFMERIQQKVAQLQAAAPRWVQEGGDPRQLEAAFVLFKQTVERWSAGWEIYYKRSADGGVTWEPDARLTAAPNVSLRPSIAALGRNVHIVWFDGRDGNAEIYYKQSRDGGSTWRADARLTMAPGASVLPSIAISGRVLHVVWSDERDGNAEIYYKRGAIGTSALPN
jgi:hypothetical protein